MLDVALYISLHLELGCPQSFCCEQTWKRPVVLPSILERDKYECSTLRLRVYTHPSAILLLNEFPYLRRLLECITDVL